MSHSVSLSLRAGIQRFLTVVGALALIGAGAVVAQSPASAAPEEFTVSEGELAAEFIVPNGVTSIEYEVVSGRGGGTNENKAAGGRGATVTGSLSVTPGQRLYLWAGARGGNGTATKPGIGGAGYRAGGKGGTVPSAFLPGGGGAGASAIAVGSPGAQAFVVAGGGGGSGAAPDGLFALYCKGGAGGDAGKPGAAGTGSPGTCIEAGQSGAGKGGAAGAAAGAHQDGGIGVTTTGNFGGVGGGGGGGGAAGVAPFGPVIAAGPGGGGGAILAPAGAVVTATPAITAPYVSLRYTVGAVPSISTTTTAVSSPAVAGSDFTVTATVTATSGVPTGSVNFSSPAASCLLVPLVAKTATSATATCTANAAASGTRSYSIAYMPSVGSKFLTSSVMHSVTIAAVPTTTSVTVSAPVIAAGDITIADAVVNSGGSGSPTGAVEFWDGGTRVGSAQLVGGHAGIMFKPERAGTHTIEARYSGSAVFSTSSGSVNLTVLAGSSTGLTVTSPVTSGDPITAEATVTSEGAAATGTVTFTLDGEVLPVALQGGVASAHFIAGAAGSYELTATYSGSVSVTGSGASKTVTVMPADRSTTTTLTISPPATTAGNPVDLTATVTNPQGRVVTGSVEFSVSGHEPIAATIVNGVASTTFTPVASGSFTVVAAYRPSGAFAKSEARQDLLVVAVPPEPTQLLLFSVAAAGMVDTPLTIAANVSTVNSAMPVKSGSVSFYRDDEVEPFAVVQLDGNGFAATDVSFGTAGTHSVRADYAGTHAYSGSQAELQFEVTAVEPPPSLDTVTTLTIDDSVIAGVSTPVSVTVRSQSGLRLPTGAVAIFLGGDLANPVVTIPLVDGIGTGALTIPTPTESLSVTAEFMSGDELKGSRDSVTVRVLEATKAATVTSLAVPSGVVRTGGTVELTATVAASGGVPTGEVKFYRNGGELVATASLVEGTATATIAFSEAGEHVIVASYAGSTSHAASTSEPVIVEVGAPVTASVTKVVVEPAELIAGQAGTLTVTVAPAEGASGTPAGDVAFYLDGSVEPFGTVALADGTGAYPFALALPGEHSVTAEYTSVNGFESSEGVVSFVVKTTEVPLSYATSTTLTLDPARITDGGAARAEVIVSAMDNRNRATPSGEVVITRAGSDEPLATAALIGAAATLTLSGLAVGDYSLVATYRGGGGFEPSTSAAVALSVESTPDAATHTVLRSLAPHVVGAEVELVAVVTADDQPVGRGTVTFLVDGVSVGSSALDQDGLARLVYTAGPAGDHVVTAQFSGVPGLAASSSDAVTLRVDPQVVPPSPTSLTLEPASAVVGQTVTATVTVSGAVPGEHSRVIVYQGDTPVGPSVPVVDGVAMVVFTLSAVGEHDIVADYLGDEFLGETTSQVRRLKIGPASTDVTVQVGQAQVDSVDTVMLRGTVTVKAPGSGIPRGVVVFSVDGEVIGVAQPNSSGVAVIRYSSALLGARVASAAFHGEEGFENSDSPAVTFTLVAPPSVTMGGVLAETGARIGWWLVPVAIVLVVGGAVIFILRRRMNRGSTPSE